MPRYTIDTCSLTAMRRVYPPDVFPGAWTKLQEVAEHGVLIAVDEVYEELKTQEKDVVFHWATEHITMFQPLDAAIQREARRILNSYPKLVDLKRRKSGADPFVIAHAIVRHCAVVTEERRSGGRHRVKIPDVCNAYKVECIGVLEMLRREGLRLRSRHSSIRSPCTKQRRGSKDVSRRSVRF